MKQEQKCPLCGSTSTYTNEKTNGKTVKKILCPKCTRLVFEEETEDRLPSSLKETKEKFIAMTKKMTTDQVLAFSLNRKIKNPNTELFSITVAVVPRSKYL